MTKTWLKRSRILFYIPRPSQRRICPSFPLRIRELVYHHYQMEVPIVGWQTYCHNQWCSACLALLVDLEMKFTHFCWTLLSSISQKYTRSVPDQHLFTNKTEIPPWLWRLLFRLKIFDKNNCLYIHTYMLIFI